LRVLGWWLGFPGDYTLRFRFATEKGFAEFDQVLFAEAVDCGGVDFESCSGGLRERIFCCG
jgi:hypothetical protein